MFSRIDSHRQNNYTNSTAITFLCPLAVPERLAAVDGVTADAAKDGSIYFSDRLNWFVCAEQAFYSLLHEHLLVHFGVLQVNYRSNSHTLAVVNGIVKVIAWCYCQHTSNEGIHFIQTLINKSPVWMRPLWLLARWDKYPLSWASDSVGALGECPWRESWLHACMQTQPESGGLGF